MTPKRAELIRMIRDMSDECLDSCHYMVGVVYRNYQGRQAMAELAALKARRPKEEPARTKLAGNVVALRPEASG